ncbi:MAG: PilZ domain-containing protein [Candidatus Omnitrophota bacterium]|nr:PilZ domain-containing protein [Candidatus Omnitrophota bacterium]
MKDERFVEKRKYARLDLRSEVEVRIHDDAKEGRSSAAFRAVGKNVGVEGICISCGKELHPGTVVDLKMFFSDSSCPVRIKGEVRWCSSSGEAVENGGFDIGVRFLKIDRNHVALMVKYLCGKLADEQVLYDSMVFREE